MDLRLTITRFASWLWNKALPFLLGAWLDGISRKFDFPARDALQRLDPDQSDLR